MRGSLGYGRRKLREIQHVINSMVFSEMAQPAGFSGELKVRSARTICVAAIERRQAKQKGPMRVWSRDPGLKILQSSWVGRVVHTPTCCYSFFPEILLWKITKTILVDTYWNTLKVLIFWETIVCWTRKSAWFCGFESIFWWKSKISCASKSFPKDKKVRHTKFT